jgi:hypothetical protein
LLLRLWLDGRALTGSQNGQTQDDQRQQSDAPRATTSSDRFIGQRSIDCVIVIHGFDLYSNLLPDSTQYLSN